MTSIKYGSLAAAAGYRLELAVLHSEFGYYIGTADETGPVSRESLEYWHTRSDAEGALKSGHWTQRNNL